MNIIKLMLITLGLAFALTSNAQQESANTMHEKDPDYALALRDSMATLRALVNDDNAQAMGFRSPKEAEAATPGVPIPLLMIQLDDLRRYQPGSDARALFKNHHQHLVPLSVGDEVRSSITLERKAQRISAISYGSPNLVRSLDSVRQQLTRQLSIAEEQFYAVHVAALREYFIGYDNSEGQVMMVPTRDHKKLNLHAGRALTADEVLNALQSVAMRYNDLPI